MVEDLKKIDINSSASDVDSERDVIPQKKEKFYPSQIKPKKKNWLKKVTVVFLLLFLILLIVSIPTMILARPLVSSAKTTYTKAQEAFGAIKNQDLINGSSKLKETQQEFLKTKSLYKRLIFLKFIPFVGLYYKDGEHFLEAGTKGMEAGLVLIEAVTPYADVLGFKGQGSFVGGTAEDRIVKIVQTLEKVTPKIDDVAGKITLAEKEIKQIDPKRYPEKLKGKEIRNKIVKGQELFADAVLGVSDAKPILEVLPSILGYPEAKKYLVLFQNDGELRATGGFMTAFAVLHLESGRVRAEKSDDIYSLDRKFKKRLEAPEPIKKYLLSADLKTGIVPYFYLRDMNLSPDFKVSMETFKKYYDDLQGEHKVDGIVAIDTKVLTDLIDTLGPIDIPGYGKFSNEKDKRCHNIAQIICELEYIVDTPLPTQEGGRKNSILGPMMQEILLKAMGSPKQLWGKLFNTGIKELQEKHMLLYFENEKAQKAAETFGAAGRIKPFDGDYLHVNDSNFGGAKSNLFTTQKTEQKIEVDKDGTVVKTLTLTYENPEPIDNCNLERIAGLCLNSILRNYIRVYIPKDSQLIEALGSEVEVKTKEELGKTYFDGFFTVRGGGGRAKMVFKYKLPFKLKEGEEYRLLIQKQPGTLGHHQTIIIGNQKEEFDLVADKELKFKI